MTQGDSDQETIDSPGEPEGLVCPACGYDLRALTSDKCPECGAEIDRTAVSISRIPWEHRAQIGWSKAYWRTVILVSIRQRQLPAEMNRSISYSSARWFQFITVLFAWAPIMVGIIALAWDELPPLSHLRPALRLGSLLQSILIASVPLSLWLFLFMVTGIASYWFHPRSLSVARQNRAVALSYYASAPIAWLWVPTLACLLANMPALIRLRGEALAVVILFGMLAAVLAVVFAVILPLMWLGNTLYLLGATTHCGTGRRAAMFICLPTLWLLCLATAAAIPVALFWASLVILSFR